MIAAISIAQPVITELRAYIDSQEIAIEMGKWDAMDGLKCQPDAYAYPDNINRRYHRGDYIQAYVTAKGL